MPQTNKQYDALSEELYIEKKKHKLETLRLERLKREAEADRLEEESRIKKELIQKEMFDQHREIAIGEIGKIFAEATDRAVETILAEIKKGTSAN